MRIVGFPAGMFQTNCYIVYDETAKSCAVIDPGYSPERVLDFVGKLGLTVDAVLLTHGQFDHVGGVEAIVKANAEATGRQFIVAGYKFGIVGKTYAGKNVKNNMLDPGYSIILSEGELKTAKFSVRPKTEIGIAAAGISDQVWVKFGDPTMGDLPLENRVMAQLVNMIKSPAEFNALIEEIRAENPAIVGLISLHTRSSGYVPEDFVRIPYTITSS